MEHSLCFTPFALVKVANSSEMNWVHYQSVFAQEGHTMQITSLIVLLAVVLFMAQEAIT